MSTCQARAGQGGGGRGRPCRGGRTEAANAEAWDMGQAMLRGSARPPAPRGYAAARRLRARPRRARPPHLVHQRRHGGRLGAGSGIPVEQQRPLCKLRHVGAVCGRAAWQRGLQARLRHAWNPAPARGSRSGGPGSTHLQSSGRQRGRRPWRGLARPPVCRCTRPTTWRPPRRAQCPAADKWTRWQRRPAPRRGRTPQPWCTGWSAQDGGGGRRACGIAAQAGGSSATGRGAGREGRTLSCATLSSSPSSATGLRPTKGVAGSGAGSWCSTRAAAAVERSGRAGQLPLLVTCVRRPMRRGMHFFQCVTAYTHRTLLQIPHVPAEPATAAPAAVPTEL